ncbi:MAG: fliD [Blastococcus sp.]|jgi:flagellar capping protein FliD|nr:fliD [Blastococcus sp.]
MTMSLSTGLISGMDTGSLITQLIAAEGAPQAALRTRLKTAELAASAYRTVNTTFLAVTAAADSALKPDVWNPVKASSSSTNVSVSANGGATPGALTFKVLGTATAHSVLEKNSAWTSAKAAYGASSITVNDAAGAPKSPVITITDTDNDGTLSLAEAAAAINSSTHGLNAAVVQVGKTEFTLQVTSRTTGADSQFSITGSGGIVTNPTLGANARIKVGDTADAFEVSSATNTFDAVLPGATFTVKAADPATAVTLTVASDPDAVATKMQTLVDAVNASLNEVRRATSNAKDSTATLKGDFSVSQLAGRLMSAVSSAVLGAGAKAADGTVPDLSPATVGFELSKDGRTVVFNKAKFITAMQSDPGLAQRMVSGRAAGTDSTGVAVTAITGVAQRLLDVAKSASDSTTGSLVKLAEGKESTLKGIQDGIAAWDLRLAKRKEALTRQFTAMETSLSSLRNQSTWLAGQINSLPSR